jgi:hypothetical protein
MSEGGKSVSAYMGDEAPERLYGEFWSNYPAEFLLNATSMCPHW